MSINPIGKIFLIFLCGSLLSLSAPGYDLWIIAWFGLTPLFIIINTSKKIKEVISYSFLFGLGYNLGYLNWLFSLHPLNWLGFNDFTSIVISVFVLVTVAVYNSLYFVIFGTVIFYLKSISVSPYDKGVPNLLLTTFIWLIVFNKLSTFKCLLGFPWTLIEYSQYKNLYLIQIAEYFGSISISFLIVFFNLLLADFLIWLVNIQKISNRYIPKDPGLISSIVKGFCLEIIFVFSSIVLGAYLYEKNHQDFTNKSQTLCVLQGNLPLKVTRGGKQDINFARKVYSDLIGANDAKLIITPEGALPTIFNKNLNVQYWLKTLASKKHLDIISGSYCNQNDILTNCAVSCSGSSKKFLYYEKERLVPFGEFTPFSFALPEFLKKFASNVIGDGFKEGKQSEPVSTSIGKAGINICFELIFPAIIRRHVIEHANFLVNISDLSWFSNDLLKQQFLSFAVFRAIENRKWVVIAANNGVSAFIEPTGKIRSQSLPNTRGVLLDWINPNSKITFYSKYGW
ncbi:MAG: apolipoprotein N-acyltransferase [Candidatus Melainabacteria bacterium]|nr:apolipoprotein N-acyltransferase [Candidatus Melainabacteria bacterium]